MLPFVAALAVLAVVSVGNVHSPPVKEKFFAANVDPSPAKANLHDSQPWRLLLHV